MTKEPSLSIDGKDIRILVWKVVENYIARESPEELPYLPVIWERLVPENMLGLPTVYDSHLLGIRLQGLYFEKKTSLRLLSPFVIAVVFAVLSEIQGDLATPKIHQLQKAVKACATQLGLPLSQAENLAEFLAPTLLAQFKRIQERAETAELGTPSRGPIAVNVSASGTFEVRGECHDNLKPQLRLLWLHLVRHRQVHWLEGFFIFERWRRRNLQNPTRQFGNLVCQLADVLKTAGSGLEVMAVKEGKANTGWWRLHCPENTLLGGEVVEAIGEAEKALAAFQQKNYNQAAELALAAVRKDPSSFAAIRVFAEATPYLPDITSNPDQLFEMVRRVSLLKNQLETAISLVNRLAHNTKPDRQSRDCAKVEDKMRQQLREVASVEAKLKASLEGRSPSTREGIEFERLNEQLQLLRDKKLSAEDRERACRELALDPPFKDVLRQVCERAMEIFHIGRSEKEEQELKHARDQTLGVFQEIIFGESFTPYKYKDMHHLLSLLRTWLSRNLVASLVDQWHGVDKTVQNDMRTMHSCLHRAGAKQEQLSEDYILSHMPKTWDISKLKATLEAQDHLWQSIDLTAYYRVFRGGRYKDKKR